MAAAGGSKGRISAGKPERSPAAMRAAVKAATAAEKIQKTRETIRSRLLKERSCRNQERIHPRPAPQRPALR
jgi:hypothetical protein